MDKHIMVSIGMPVLNGEQYLRLAIRSVLMQTFTNFELIICNDGSTDNSESIILSFNDARIKYIKNDVNQGISVSLNRIISISNGKYFARMDADDIMLSSRLQIQVNHLENHPNLDVIGSCAFTIDSSNRLSFLYAINEQYTLKQAFRQSVFIHPCVMGRLDWFRSNPYNPAFDGAEDFDLFLRTYSYSAFQNLQVPLLFYRTTKIHEFGMYYRRNMAKMRSVRMNEKQLNSNFYFSYIVLLNQIKLILVNLSLSFGFDKVLNLKRFKKMDVITMKYNQQILSNLVQE